MSDDCFYIALKFKAGFLDTTDGRSGYRYKPGARMYPSRQPASGMRRRWLGEGYDARLARFWVDDEGNPQVEFCDQDDDIKPVCRATKTQLSNYINARTNERVAEVTHRCVLDIDHKGRHSTTRSRGYRNQNDFDADGEPS